MSPTLMFPDLSFLIRFLKSQPAYGWIPDPYDERDEGYAFNTTAAVNRTATLQFIDNSKFFKEVSSQLHLPSCAANAGADLVEAVDIKQRCEQESLETARQNVPNYSRMFLWWNARNEMDPPKSKDAGSGCYNRLVMDVVSRFGLCREDLWPYNEDTLPPYYQPRTVVRPSLSAYRDARGHMTASYHSLTGHGDQRLEEVVKALQATPGVLFGTSIGPAFGDTKPDDILMKPLILSGKHAMIIVGYDASRRAFKIRNSWGVGFADKGYCWMHESYIAWSGTRSLWVCTKGVLA